MKILLYFCFLLCYQFVPIDCGLAEKRLLGYLFDQDRWDAHNPMERPSIQDSKPVQVFLKCFLNQIMDVDEKNQILSTILWLDLKWFDYHFVWNASDYSNIQMLNLPPERIWKPDLILYNSASEKFDQIFPTKVTLRSNGIVQWVPPGLFHSICDIEVTWFPFDSQNCIMKFGTWTYQGNTVDLRLQCDNETGKEQPCHLMNEVDLSTFLAHSEWALESALVKRNMGTYGDNYQHYVDLTIYIHMQRRALYYMFNIIIPCMIMSVMALLVFTLPPNANEKIVLGVTTLLSLTMLLQLVADKLPQTSSGNPVLVLYFTCTMILCSLSLVCAVVLLNCHHHSGGIIYVPWWIETFINVWLASVLRIVRVGDEDNKNETNHEGREFHFIPAQSTNEQTAFSAFSVSSGSDNNHNHTNINSPSMGPTTLPTEEIDPSSTVWSNVIDLNLEFRPTALTPSKMNTDLQRDSCSMKRSRNPFSASHQSDSMMRKCSRLEYACLQNDPLNSKNLQQVGRPPVRPRRKLIDSKLKSEDNLIQHKSPPQPVKWITTPSTASLASTGAEFTASNVGSFPELTAGEQISRKNLVTLKRLKLIVNELKLITSRMHREEQEARTSAEWRLACRVLDRLCLLIFASLNLFTTLGILTSAPTVIKAFTSRGFPSQKM